MKQRNDAFVRVLSCKSRQCFRTALRALPGRCLVSVLAAAALVVTVSGSGAGASAVAKTPPICGVLKTALNFGVTASGKSLSADQVLAGEQKTAAALNRYKKTGPAPIRSSLKTLAAMYKRLVALGRPIDDQADPNGAATQQAAISKLFEAPAIAKAIQKITLYDELHLHCNLNP